MDPIVVRDWFHQLPSPRNKISNKRNEFVWLQNQISKHHKNHVIEKRCVLIWIYLMHISGSLIAFIQKWTPLIRNFDQLTNFWFNSWWKVRGRYFFPGNFHHESRNIVTVRSWLENSRYLYGCDHQSCWPFPRKQFYR